MTLNVMGIHGDFLVVKSGETGITFGKDWGTNVE